MGCSNTKAIPSAGGLDNGTLTNAINVLNTIDSSQVRDEGGKIITQAQEVIEKSAAALENVMNGKNPFEETLEKAENIATDISKTVETLTEDQDEEEKAEAEVEIEEVESKDNLTEVEPSEITVPPETDVETQNEDLESDPLSKVEEGDSEDKETTSEGVESHPEVESETVAEPTTETENGDEKEANKESTESKEQSDSSNAADEKECASEDGDK